MLMENQCRNHNKIIARISGAEKRIDSIDDKSFVPSVSFRWTIGIVIMIVMSLYGYTLKMLYDNQDRLIEIRMQQQVILYRVETLQDSVFDLKWDAGGDYGPKRNSSSSKDRRAGSR